MVPEVSSLSRGLLSRAFSLPRAGSAEHDLTAPSKEEKLTNSGSLARIFCSSQSFVR
jgi:hypothetical protein